MPVQMAVSTATRSYRPTASAPENDSRAMARAPLACSPAIMSGRNSGVRTISTGVTERSGLVTPNDVRRHGPAAPHEDLLGERRDGGLAVRAGDRQEQRSIVGLGDGRDHGWLLDQAGRPARRVESISALVATPSLVRMWATWCSTVLAEMNSVAPMS